MFTTVNNSIIWIIQLQHLGCRDNIEVESYGLYGYWVQYYKYILQSYNKCLLN